MRKLPSTCGYLLVVALVGCVCGLARQNPQSPKVNPAAAGVPNGAASRLASSTNSKVWIPPAGHPLGEIEQIEKNCFDYVNNERTYRGLPPLDLDKNLLEIARAYSRRMATENFFAHEDPKGLNVVDRVRAAGIRSYMLGENLASNRGYMNPAAVALEGWMDSSGHRKNILDSRFNSGAVGVWFRDDGTVYFTEIFMRK